MWMQMLWRSPWQKGHTQQDMELRDSAVLERIETGGSITGPCYRSSTKGRCRPVDKRPDQ